MVYQGRKVIINIYLMVLEEREVYWSIILVTIITEMVSFDK